MNLFICFWPRLAKVSLILIVFLLVSMESYEPSRALLEYAKNLPDVVFQGEIKWTHKSLEKVVQAGVLTRSRNKVYT